MKEDYYNRPKSTTRTLFNLSVITAILLIGFSVFYYFVIFLPGKERAREEYIQNQKILTDSCLKNVERSLIEEWDKNCKNINEESKCKLPTNMADSIINNNNHLRDECYKRYPQ